MGECTKHPVESTRNRMQRMRSEIGGNNKLHAVVRDPPPPFLFSRAFNYFNIKLIFSRLIFPQNKISEAYADFNIRFSRAHVIICKFYSSLRCVYLQRLNCNCRIGTIKLVGFLPNILLNKFLYLRLDKSNC